MKALERFVSRHQQLTFTVVVLVFLFVILPILGLLMFQLMRLTGGLPT